MCGRWKAKAILNELQRVTCIFISDIHRYTIHAHTFCKLSFYWEPMLIVHIFYGCVYTLSLSRSLSLSPPLSFHHFLCFKTYHTFASFDQVYSRTVEMQWKWNWNCTYKKTWDGLCSKIHYIVETGFFYDRYSQFNFIYFCLKWTNISFETKTVRVECRCVLSFSSSWNCSFIGYMWK